MYIVTLNIKYWEGRLGTKTIVFKDEQEFNEWMLDADTLSYTILGIQSILDNRKE